jgi:glutathione S-transferase
METILTGWQTLVIALFLASLFGGPVVLVDWLRKRREETIRRQIVLTEAIDGHFGAIVSPVVMVKRPIWGPWKILMAVPFARPAAVARILALANEVLSVADRMSPDRYEIVLTPKPDPNRAERSLGTTVHGGTWRRESRLAV